jgi:hypothetical protein
MRRAQLIILAVTVAAAVAILAPALAQRAQERGGSKKGTGDGAQTAWPGFVSRFGEKPAGTTIALYGDLALAEKHAIPADAAFGPRNGALELVEALAGGITTAAAADAAGPPFAIEVKAGAARQKVAFFGTSASANDLASLGEAIRAFETAEPGALVVAYASSADPDARKAESQASDSRRLRRAGAEIVVWYGGDRVGALSQSEQKWIFYGLGGASGGESLVLRLIVGADDKGNPSVELRGYPMLDGRTVTAREYGAAYWNLILESWAPEEHLLKRRIGLGFDDVGRHFSFGKVAIDGRP